MSRLCSVLFVSCALIACGRPRANPTTGATSAASVMPTAPSADDCGDVRFSLHEQCPADRLLKFGCFVASKRACRPSRLGIESFTEEGATIRTEYRLDASCKLNEQTDDTDDTWSARPGIHTRTCHDVRLVTIFGCSTLITVDCLQ